MSSGIKFFSMNFADINRAAASISIDNNSAESDSLINRDPFWAWTSTGSDDTDTITLDVDFGQSREVDTLILVENNLKEFTLSYLSGVSYIPVLSVTDNAETTYQASFASFNAQYVRFTMTRTMTADAQKTLRDFIITKQIGQFVGYPTVQVGDDTDVIKKRLATGKYKFVQDGQASKITVQFQNHVGENDRTLINTLREWPEEFLIWPCGGNADQFAFNDIGYRLKDIYLVGADKGFTHSFTKGLFNSGMNGTLNLYEAS